MPTERKKRVLFCNDAHYLYTGYAKYGNEILNRLADTEKYDLAELACYGKVNDPKDMNARWMFYANHVDENHPQFRQYNSNPQNKFGKWRFERTLLDFKPDIVMDIRDPWMLTFEEMSPLRPFYNWAIMPTVDSAPQKDEWLEIFMGADGVFTYSDWGKDVLNRECNGHINTVASAPPGCDIDTYRPVGNKVNHKKRMGFFQDCNIVGTIMRNQGRKLYPDLLQTFRRFIDLCYERDNKELANKTFLYLHCSYPDVGWEIPELIKEHGLGRKVIVSYICKLCHNPFCAFFRDAKTMCPNCGQAGAVLPNTNVGLEPEQLSDVLNMFDLYIQYAICEGFGMPQVEAASCGVPVMSVDYSAMSDVVRKVKGVPLDVERMFRDIGTNSYRALPDNEAAAEALYKFLKLPEAIKRRHGRDARKAVEKHYTWDNTAKIWENYLDSIQLTGLQGQWDAPMRRVKQVKRIEHSYLRNPEYVRWLITEVMQEPRLLNTRFSMKTLRNLNYGGRPSMDKNGESTMVPVSRDSLFNAFSNYAKNKKDCELARCGHAELGDADFIRYARSREEYL